MSTRTLVVFPTYIGQLVGVNAVEIGVTYVWVRKTDGTKPRILRSAFTPEELSGDSHRLAFRALELINQS